VPEPGARAPHWVPGAGPAPERAVFRLVTTGPADGELSEAAQKLAASLPALVVHQHVARHGSAFLLLRPDGFVSASGVTADGLTQARNLLAEVAA
ncbi:hypothetical protein GTW78_24390, partial [Streptomyces sp. SID4948]|nr:hypothetical protein [Streptomyces sp. SID4948]